MTDPIILFQPDPTNIPSMSRVDSPERRLFLAVLEDALSMILAPKTPAFQRRSDLEWLNATHSDDAFSVASICEALGIDHGALVRQVKAKLNGGAEMFNDTATGYYCATCKRAFVSRTKFGAHNRRHGGKAAKSEPPPKRFRCGPCGLDFRGSRSLANHQEKKHGVKFL